MHPKDRKRGEKKENSARSKSWVKRQENRLPSMNYWVSGNVGTRAEKRKVMKKLEFKESRYRKLNEKSEFCEFFTRLVAKKIREKSVPQPQA